MLNPKGCARNPDHAFLILPKNPLKLIALKTFVIFEHSKTKLSGRTKINAKLAFVCSIY